MLAQIGLIDKARLPVTGAEQAARLLDPSLPSNTLIPKARSWDSCCAVCADFVSGACPISFWPWLAPTSAL